MITTLIKSILNSNDLDTTIGVVGSIRNVSTQRQGQLAILKCGGIPALVKLMRLFLIIL